MDVTFFLARRYRLCYLHILLTMRHLSFATTILVAFIFLTPLSLTHGASITDEKAVVGAIAQEEEDLPEDPLGRKSTNERSMAKRNDAELIPVLEGTLNKVKSAVEAIRNALLNSSTTSPTDMPVIFNESVQKHIRIFMGPKRGSFARWLIRAKKYEPTIRRILKEHGLPEDLVYVAMIESGFNMKACSRANAMGPWQFMDQTGRQYGLRVDYWVDERYDLEKSTVAAARYLKKLFDQFGCWYLVAASYNAGENRVKKAMENSRTTDFWELREYHALPQETREYVPQLVAASVIAKDPEMYGFITTDSIAAYKLTKIAVPGGVPLKDIARVQSVEFADLRALNPELLQGITPPNVKRYRINLPGGNRPIKVKAWERQVVGVQPYRIKAKDTIRTIERRYNVVQADLCLVNASGLQLEQGKTIYVPRFAVARSCKRSPQGRPKTRLASLRIGTAGQKTSAAKTRRVEKRNSAKGSGRKMVRPVNKAG